MTALSIEIPGRAPKVVTPPTELVFGRASTGGVLCLLGPDDEEDMTLSRHAGIFVHDGVWMLRNPAEEEHRRPAFKVAQTNGTQTQLPPGAAMPLPPQGVITFRTRAERRYELRFRVEGASETSAPPMRPPSVGDRTDPVPKPLLEMTPREVDFCVTLAAPEIIGESDARRPTLSEVAKTWHVARSTVDNTLGDLRKKAAVQGLIPSEGDPSDKTRTVRLVRALVDLGLLTLEDYDWAFGGGAVRSSIESPRFLIRPPRYTDAP